MNITALFFQKQRHALVNWNPQFLPQKSAIAFHRMTSLKQLKKTYSFMLPGLRENNLLSKAFKLDQKGFNKL